MTSPCAARLARRTVASPEEDGLPESSVKLNEAQEERALRLHESSLVFVSHDHEIRAEDIALMRPGGVTAKQLQISLDG
ncbi:MAG TPA: hypothetical protein VGQ86_08065, partial [Candidatus Limnocylindria bacterium]|nr:hypothetical protein [Candidatus Limnocylindria bacterium]